jgi:hypothetical protein
MIRAYAAAGRHQAIAPHAAAVMTAAHAAAEEIAAVTRDPEQSAVAFERWRLARYENPARPDRVSPALLAGLHAYVGDFDAALALLQTATEARELTLPFTLLDPSFAPIRDQPSYRAIAVQVGIAAAS